MAAYLGTGAFRRELGFIQPAANLRYFYYSDDHRLDRLLHVLYGPCDLLFPDMRHVRDRSPIRVEDFGP